MKAIAFTMIIGLMLLSAMPVAAGLSDDILGTSADVPDGLIPIYDASDLQKVGSNKTQTGSSGTSYYWGLGSDYVLMNDILLDAPVPDTELTVTRSEGNVTITITDLSGTAVFSGTAYMGSGTAEISDGVVTLPYCGDSMLTLTGMKDSVPFAHSFTVIGDTMTETFAVSGNFVPIGTSLPFTGTFDGNHRTISGMEIRMSAVNATVYAGMFRTLSGASIYHITITDAKVYAVSQSTNTSANVYAGTIAGSVGGGTIVEGCDISGTVTSVRMSDGGNSTICSGGIVGMVNPPSGATVRITECTFTGDTVSKLSSSSATTNTIYSGGTVGYGSNVDISGCENDVRIRSDVYVGKVNAYAKTFAGGIAGYVLNSNITRCINEGSIHAEALPLNGNGVVTSVYAGGILGASESSYYSSPILYSGSSVSYCGNSADITAISGSENSLTEAGGLVGHTNGYFRMISCFNTGEVNASASDTGMKVLCAGGLVGSAGYGDVHIAYSYNAGKVNASGTDVGAAVGHTTNGVRSSYLVALDTSADHLFGETLSGTAYDTGSVKRTMDEMRDRGTYEWPSFNTMWAMASSKNNGLPYFVSDMADMCTVFLITAGGEPIPPMMVERGETLDLPIPVKQGATFKGWYTGPNGTGDRMESVHVTEDMTLYAYWEVSSKSTSSGDWIWLFILFLVIMTAILLMYMQEKRKHRYDQLK